MQPERFLVLAYTIEGKTMQLFLLDKDAFGDAIVAGKLQGAAPRPWGLLCRLFEKYESVTVTDSPKKSREFLAANQGTAIETPRFMTFTREPPPENKPIDGSAAK